MAVTQAALWRWGGSDGAVMYGNLDDVFARCWSLVTAGYEFGQIGSLDANERAAAMSLFKVLVAEDKTASELALNKTTHIVEQEDLREPVATAVGTATKDEFMAQVVVPAADEPVPMANGPDMAMFGARDDEVQYYNSNVTVGISGDPDLLCMDGAFAVLKVDGAEVASMSFESAKALPDKTGIELTVENVVLPGDTDVDIEIVGGQALLPGGYVLGASNDTQALCSYITAGSRPVMLKTVARVDTAGLEYRLPDTGGSGTIAFVMTGILLAGSSGCFLLVRRRGARR